MPPSSALATEPTRVDTSVLSGRIKAITGDINRNWLELLESQSVEVIYGQGRFVSDREVVVETESGERRIGFDRAMVSTGSAPRVPEWAPVDGERVLTTRDCYDMVDVPEHMVIIGSGVTGVEFTHIFESLGSKVSLVVSRRQILPHRDAEVAAVLEEDFLERGVHLAFGARAEKIDLDGSGVSVFCDDGRVLHGSHALLAVGSIPLTDGLDLEAAGVAVPMATSRWTSFSERPSPTSTRPAMSPARCPSRRWLRCRGGRSPVTPSTSR